MCENTGEEMKSIVQDMQRLEKYLGFFLVGIACIINIIWLFSKAAGFALILDVAKVAYIRAASVIWTTGFGVYVLSVLLIWKNNKKKILCGIKAALCTVMTAEIFLKQCLLWSSVLSCFLLVFLVLLLYLHVVMNKQEEVNPALLRKNIFKYRDDRKYLFVLADRIQSEDLKNRIANEVGTYVYSAYKYKRRFYGLTILSIGLPAGVVALNSIEAFKGDSVNVAVSFLSMATVIVTGIMSTMKARESWIRNREYAERAKNEIFNCIMRIEEYKDNDGREEMLAKRLEELYMEERGMWKKLRGADSAKNS